MNSATGSDRGAAAVPAAGGHARGARIDWIDAARGIGILLVVIGHVERGLFAAGMAMGPGWQWADFALYSFHMPLFFLLAGLNVRRSLRHGTSDFLRAKLVTIAWPYVLWSLIQGGILVMLARFTNGGATGAELIAIPWQPMAQFWFLYVLFLYQLLALAAKARALPLALAAVFGLILATWFDQNSLGERLGHFLAFFTLGVLLAERLTIRPSWPAAAMLLAGFVVAVWAGGRWAFPRHDALMMLPAAGCGVAGALMLARALAGRLLQMFAALGRASMTVFVLHILAGAGTRIIMLRLGVAPLPVLYLVVCTAAGLVFPLIADHFLGRMDIKPLLGLAAPRRTRAPATEAA